MFQGFQLQGQQASLGQTFKQEVTKLSSVLGPFSSWKFGDIYGIMACSRAFPHYTRVIGTRAIPSHHGLVFVCASSFLKAIQSIALRDEQEVPPVPLLSQTADPKLLGIL